MSAQSGAFSTETLPASGMTLVQPPGHDAARRRHRTGRATPCHSRLDDAGTRWTSGLPARTRTRPGVPISLVLVTSRGAARCCRAGLRVGADDYVVEPPDNTTWHSGR